MTVARHFDSSTSLRFFFRLARQVLLTHADTFDPCSHKADDGINIPIEQRQSPSGLGPKKSVGPFGSHIHMQVPHKSHIDARNISRGMF